MGILIWLPLLVSLAAASHFNAPLLPRSNGAAHPMRVQHQIWKLAHQGILNLVQPEFEPEIGPDRLHRLLIEYEPQTDGTVQIKDNFALQACSAGNVKCRQSEANIKESEPSPRFRTMYIKYKRPEYLESLDLIAVWKADRDLTEAHKIALEYAQAHGWALADQKVSLTRIERRSRALWHLNNKFVYEWMAWGKSQYHVVTVGARRGVWSSPEDNLSEHFGTTIQWPQTVVSGKAVQRVTESQNTNDQTLQPQRNRPSLQQVTASGPSQALQQTSDAIQPASPSANQNGIEDTPKKKSSKWKDRVRKVFTS